MKRNPVSTPNKSCRLKTLLVCFKNEIAPWEVPALRGAIVASMKNKNVLFHNHVDTGLRYSYPLIQYKCIRNRAAVFCVGEGTDAIGDFLTTSNFEMHISGRDELLEVASIRAEQTLVACWQTPLGYHLKNWTPLNEVNNDVYESLTSIEDKQSLLNHILVGHILSALKGLNYTAEEQITCSIENIYRPRTINFKGLKLKGFDIDFISNISLPNNIGLGRHVSVGMGNLTRQKVKTQIEEA